MASAGAPPSAQWIWVPGLDERQSEKAAQFALFRKTVIVEEVPKGTCIINVSADTRYRLYVNGQNVSFGPCKSYPSKHYYESVDITPFLSKGENVIGAKVLRFPQGQIGSTSFMPASIPGFILWGTIQNQEVITDNSWRCTEDSSVLIRPRSEWNYILGPPFLSLEERATLSLGSQWMTRGFDDSGWSSATLSTVRSKMMPALEPWKLHPRPIPTLHEATRQFSHLMRCSENYTQGQWEDTIQGRRSITIGPKESVFLELGIESLTTAFFTLQFQGGHGAEVKLLYSEGYEKDLGVDKAPFPLPRNKGNRSDAEKGRLYGYEDILTIDTADGQQMLYEPFWFRTFRYVRIAISTADMPLNVQDITFRDIHYPLQTTSRFELPAELAPIWDISVNTLRNCMHDTYEDCPYYEQNQFAMDTRLQILFTYQLCRDDRLARKTIDEFAASRRGDGLLETNFPVSFRAINIPQFSLYWILMLYDHMMYFDDKTLIKKHLGTADGILAYFDSLVNEDGLIGTFDPECWGFVDWVDQWQGNPAKGIREMAVPPVYKTTGVATFNSLIYSFTLQRAADLCEHLRRLDTAADYRQRAASLNDAVNRHCFDTSTSMYTDGCKKDTNDKSQHTQIFAILSNAVSESTKAQKLLGETLADSSLPQCSLALSHYIFQAVHQVEEPSGTTCTMVNNVLKNWNIMLENNLTTCPESMSPSTRSDCHGWSASPIYEIAANLYGITPAAPGFSKIRLQPNRQLLEAGDAEFDLGRGILKIKWENKDSPISVQSSCDIEVDFVSNGQVKLLELKRNEAIDI